MTICTCPARQPRRPHTDPACPLFGKFAGYVRPTPRKTYPQPDRLRVTIEVRTEDELAVARAGAEKALAAYRKKVAKKP